MDHKVQEVKVSTKGKIALAAALILLTLFIIFQAFQPYNRSNDLRGQEIDDWRGWAKVAWGYFQPGVGLNPSTGLHYAALGWHRFTDWDLGVYISAIIDAEKLGLITREEPWGSNKRLEVILNFLETRPITDEGLPYAQYDADTGAVPEDMVNRTAHPSDVAKLLLALDDLRRFRPELDSRIQRLISRYNLELLSKSNYFARDDVYVFYSALGYWAFNLSTPKFRGLETLGGGYTLEIYSETLPKAGVTTEPLVLAILENRSSDLYRDLADRVFRVQQKRFEATGKLTAFSEGAYPAPPFYVYEWIATGEGETWIIWAGGKINGSEVVYTKIAFAFHAIYNNQYTRTLVRKASQLGTERGFLEGVMEDGRTLEVLTDKTNGMILQAARYSLFSRPTLVTLAPNPFFPRYAITTFVVTSEHAEEQLRLLRRVGAYNFTLIYREDEVEKVRLIFNIFGNYTDCIIPELSFMQTLKPLEREQVINEKFMVFKSVMERYPSGIFSFQLDTYTLNYVKDKFGVKFAIGNVWDQVNIDFMSLRGGFSTPYYASRRHSLIPAKTREEASLLVIPPLAIAPTDRYHFDNNHIIDLYNLGVGVDEFKYVSLNHPFFTPFFLELDWLFHTNNTEIFIESYTWVYKNFNVVTAEQFTKIFETRFPVNPEYHFIYTSSNSNAFPETKGWRIEWLMNPNHRIARIGERVVSALNYDAQKEDPFLSNSVSINFSSFRFGENPHNVVCTDLSFDIDDLWQSEYGDRKLNKTGCVVYTGELQNFYNIYNQAKLMPSTIDGRGLALSVTIPMEGDDASHFISLE